MNAAAAGEGPARGGARVRVAVCVATFCRPGQLAALLESLAAQALPADTEAWLCVVDNDRQESARAVVDAARPRLPFAVDYEVEPERNISLARNRGVARALERGADCVAFIDDDEVARPDWLAALLAARARFGADAVAGAVVPRTGPGTPPWVGRSRLFAQVQPAAGTPLPTAATSNALVSRRLLEAVPGPFDPVFGLSGSGDSLFFTRAVRQGARLVAAPGAVVDEVVPPSRARVRWVLRRGFRVGNGAVWLERTLPPENRRLGWRIVAASARLVGSASVLPVAALMGRAAALRALWGVCYGAGCLAALAGYRYSEYAALDR
ncbi:MAG TPA: glycosyltransferase [Longimicrobium sp.]|nr:glycosyltransferase [Longimicrobium sp.]